VEPAELPDLNCKFILTRRRPTPDSFVRVAALLDAEGVKSRA
jgi:hypothetical protein